MQQRAQQQQQQQQKMLNQIATAMRAKAASAGRARTNASPRRGAAALASVAIAEGAAETDSQSVALRASGVIGAKRKLELPSPPATPPPPSDEEEEPDDALFAPPSPLPSVAADEEAVDDDASEEIEARPPLAKRRKTAMTISCAACCSAIPAASVAEQPFCPVCDLIHTSAEDSIPNRLRASRLQAPALASGASSSVQSSQLDTTPSKPKLGAYESELRRLLETAGDPFLRFQSPDAIGHEAAIKGLRTHSFSGMTFAHQSPWLTKLIRSGHFKELSLGLPRSNADALKQLQGESKAKGILVLDGKLVNGTTSESHVERNLTSLQEFLKIIIVSILPSLFDSPRASLDWLELARTVIEVTQREGWPVANRYLQDLLNDRVPTSAPFNEFDHQLLQTVRILVPTSPDTGAAPAAAAGAGGRVNTQIGGACRNWNGLGQTSACANDPCPYKHRCIWNACPSPNDGHRGKDCVAKGSSAPPRQAPGSGGHRQQRPAGRPPAVPPVRK